MNELVLIQNIGLILLMYCGIALAVVGTVRLIRNPSREVEKVRSEYERRIGELKEHNKELRERIDELKKMHKEELQKYTKTSKMLLELHAALSKGVVKLACPQHPKEEVTLLADGTIVCSKGHRLWPVRKGEEA